MPLNKKISSPSAHKRRGVSQAELAEIIGVSVATAGRMIRSGQIGSIKIRNRRIIPVSEIDKLLTPAA